MKFIHSLRHAFNGISFLVRNERNFQIELIVALVVTACAAILNFSRGDWIKILLCILFVLSMEAINTAIEKTLDKLHPDYDEEIGKIKDIAAGAVLIAAILAVCVGGLVFWRYY